ncbi:hypothetical protein HK104_009085 [Borealophlyctis nickersoniae]|nr:hypothetical protein HK104_009085 [Borealophlyctis nickersoniae]
MVNVGLEMFKFGVYIMFPVGIFALFNRPEIVQPIWDYHDKSFDMMHEKTLLKMPKSREELEIIMENMRRSKQRRLAQQQVEAEAAQLAAQAASEDN